MVSKSKAIEMVIFSYVYFHLFAAVYGIATSFVKYELYSENEIHGNSILSFDTSSLVACVSLCDSTFGCLSVNFHKDNAKCLLTDYYPTDNTRSGEASVGWKIFFRRNFDIDLLEGASAWQSSTYVNKDISFTADHAIDGISDCDNPSSIAHTYNNFSYWAVEFGTPGPVKGVEIYFRTSCCFYFRNNNFTVTVSKSRDDVTNDNGTLCGTYYGSAIDKAPFHLTINCESTIYGKFLKIKHGMAEKMVLCEVIVQTP
ncbi:uncharacterized protein LOC123535140 [Mercenaria mercenaria]|uniref:uncharacterized protein LOC123535140 n=1 Tax=Mercenaria mercenaria TaxID=6596 RepID=UPI00234F97D8|nr:uncharacterized protein LOC123535140 [Mercenaria mercenaria]